MDHQHVVRDAVDTPARGLQAMRQGAEEGVEGAGASQRRDHQVGDGLLRIAREVREAVDTRPRVRGAGAEREKIPHNLEPELGKASLVNDRLALHECCGRFLRRSGLGEDPCVL